MRTKVFFFSLLMGLVMVGSTLNVYAEEPKLPTQQTGPVIILTPEEILDGSDDRGIVIIPLEAYYQGETIFLDFTYNVGNVEVSVRNTTIGNSWSGTVDSADGMGEISIAGGGAGSYTLTLVTAYGDKYHGTFTID